MVMDWAHSVFWRDRRGARDAFVSSHFQVPKDSRTFRVSGGSFKHSESCSERLVGSETEVLAQ
jgi:hypothetical protein